MKTKLPSGTITFLFTDVEGSTQLWENHPQAMQAALAQHDAILRETIETNNGHLIKSTGDGALAVFATAIDAVDATLAAQRGFQGPLAGVQIKVRMRLHTDEAELRAEHGTGDCICHPGSFGRLRQQVPPP